MRKIVFLVPGVLLGIVVVCVLASERAGDAKSPISVLIFKEAVYSREGVTESTAISVVNPKMIDALESLFPNYRKFPSSPLAGGWIAGYRVYFNFPKGRTVCVTVSANDNGQTWTIGDGDFATKGNFEKLVAQIQAKSP